VAATISPTSQLRRAIEITAAVGIWIALGITLHLSVNAYLLLGIPLTAGFQWVVRREPLRALWLRDAPPLRLDAAGWVIAALLAAYPFLSFCSGLAHGIASGKAWLLSFRGRGFIRGSLRAPQLPSRDGAALSTVLGNRRRDRHHIYGRRRTCGRTGTSHVVAALLRRT